MFAELRQPAAPKGQAAQQTQSMPGSQADGHDHAGELAPHQGAGDRHRRQSWATRPSGSSWATRTLDTHQAKQSIRAYETALGLARPARTWTDLGIMQSVRPASPRRRWISRPPLAINPRHENALYNMGVVHPHDAGDKAGAATRAGWRRSTGTPGDPGRPPAVRHVAELK